MLDITIGIMSYNRPHFLTDAITSVLAQTVKPKKIIIFDNGSDEGLVRYMEKYLIEGIEWVGSSKSESFIWNFERAFALCTTKYLMLLHDDDRLLKNFLEKQMELLAVNDDVVALSCNGYFINGNNVRFGPTLSPFNVGSGLKYFKTPGQVGIKYASNSCIPFSPTIYKANALSYSGISCEYGKVADAVFFCKLAKNGVIAVNEQPLYEARFHSGQDSQLIPFVQLQLLEDFFWDVDCKDREECQTLRRKLIRQHSTRNIRLIADRIKVLDFKSIPALLVDKRFNFISALISIIKYCFRDRRLYED